MSEHMDFTCATHIADLDAWLARAMAAEARVEELIAACKSALRFYDAALDLTGTMPPDPVEMLRAALASGSTLAGEKKP